VIKVIVNNEELDIDEGQVVTFKRSQQLNGIQNQYSYSNNFNLKNSSKNRRLLGINYLPNSKAKSMTVGYDCDIVLNGCIFLKSQKLKVQKESQNSIPVYVIFTDSLFTARCKEKLLNDIDLGITYDKSLPQFISLNDLNGFQKTAPISAQDNSGFVALEEVPALLNIVPFVSKLIIGIGYNFTGSFFTDVEANKYYMNPNLGIYGVGGSPKFDNKLTVFEFITHILKTFNAYIDVSDSQKEVGIYLWNGIENMKSIFVDYSGKFVNFTEYAFEGGLAKTNTIEYSGSQPFYNSFFENNKSIIDSKSYLKSDFGAGNMRLFSDQDLNENNTLPLRVVGETGEPSEINIYRFEAIKKQTAIYLNGVKQFVNVYRAFSPNILEIFNLFHAPYVKNIALPTIGNLIFRYDAIFLANLKFQNVFFIKQLSTYWLPLELNFSTKKDKVNIKALMIEKTQADIPVVFDLNISLGFFESYIINDASPLYSSQNKSPQSIFTVISFDLSLNNVFITGNNNVRTQILAFPFNIDVGTKFVLEFENIEPVNTRSNSDLFFQFTSEEGGVSRIAKINIAHNGRANYVSEFRMLNPQQINFTGFRNEGKTLNYSQKITTPINIPLTLSPNTGVVNNVPEALANFKFLRLQFPTSQRVIIQYEFIGNYFISLPTASPFNQSRLTINYNLYVNGLLFRTLRTNGALFPAGAANGSTRTIIESMSGELLSIFPSGAEISFSIDVFSNNDISRINTQINLTQVKLIFKTETQL